MKTLKTPLLFAAIFAALNFDSSAEWSFITMLRGEPQEPSYERVAFIGSATVRQVEGAAELLCGIDRWKPVTPGTRIRPGDVLRTSTGSIVLKMERTDSFVRVAENTVFRLVPEQHEEQRALASAR
jgi:hypothetical protein